MAYSSSSSMQDLFYMDSAPVASTSTSTPPTRFTVDYAPRTPASPIHNWLAAHRSYLPHDEPSCSTPRSAFSDDEEESESEEEQDESESEDESEEDEREMIFLRPRRHGSASPFTRSSSDLAPPQQQRKLRSNVSAPVLPSAPLAKSKKNANSPRMIAALASYRPRPAQPIVDRAQASGTSSFDAAPCTSHWSSDEDEDEEEHPRGRPYRRSTLRPRTSEDEEALWLAALDDDEEVPGLMCEASSTRSVPIPISPFPLRHPYFDPSRDDVSIVLDPEHSLSLSSPPQDAKAARQVFQKGQSFYNGWLREYVSAHH